MESPFEVINDTQNNITFYTLIDSMFFITFIDETKDEKIILDTFRRKKDAPKGSGKSVLLKSLRLLKSILPHKTHITLSSVPSFPPKTSKEDKILGQKKLNDYYISLGFQHGTGENAGENNFEGNIDVLIDTMSGGHRRKYTKKYQFKRKYTKKYQFKRKYSKYQFKIN